MQAFYSKIKIKHVYQAYYYYSSTSTLTAFSPLKNEIRQY